ncbi:MAG: HAMP domain-containing histidine kinase [Anaerolineales bacterium]|nr:HAMP domain-containing histidine kinase [Anaerolineales bacterium]
MDLKTLDFLHIIFQKGVQQSSWKTSMEALISAVRQEFVFDNVAVYMIEPDADSGEVIYARAVGRGKKAEADVAWGELIAGQVFIKNQIIVQEPKKSSSDDRLHQAFLIGAPLYMGNSEAPKGALVFIRFGGPPFSTEDIRLTSFVGLVVMQLVEHWRYQDVVKQLEALRRQVQLQDDFVATISHELRTPLGFIKGYSTTLLRRDTIWDEETVQEFLTIIDEEADRLTELIENILESARLESDTLEMNFQPIRLDALIRDAATRAQVRHKFLVVDLDVDKATTIYGDGVRLSEVFENLFSNAAKYAPGTKIEIRIENRHGNLLVLFKDNGPGIASEYLPFIFDRFYRVPSQTTSPGTGLGLYICKQIVQAHHGKIWAVSIPGDGTTFCIELPA